MTDKNEAAVGASELSDQLGVVTKDVRMWENTDKLRPDSGHYSIIRKLSEVDGMDALRAMFPDAEANELNFVLFSTSGVHGTYNTIEEAERSLAGEVDEDGDSLCDEITFVIVHPRLVSLRYGVLNPKNQDDIEYLKRLRASSHKAVAGIGFDDA